MSLHFLSTAEFWVAVSFVGFIGLLLYYKVPGMVAGLLDKRAAEISKTLDEARRLRDEAQALLASYQAKQREAMQEAESIVAQAKVEAERLAQETRANLQTQVERRTQVAQDKIARAEAQAIADVRAVAAEVAVSAAQRVIASKVDASKDAQLIEKSISELAAKLH